MREEKQSNRVFYIFMGGMVLFFVLTLLVTKGQSAQHFLFWDRNDRYADFFDSMNNSVAGMNPYDAGCIYPPLTYLFYRFVGRFLPMELVLEYDKYAVRNTRIGLNCYYIYTVVVMALLLALIWRFLESEKIKKMLLFIMVLASMPFIYNFDRGNIVVLCMAFLMFYVFAYRSENKIVRELALISLAVATAIKIYPVVFGALLLLEKRWKDALRCIGYGILIFFLPFFVFGDLGDFAVMLENIGKTSELLGSGAFGYRVNFSNTIYAFFTMAGLRGTGIDIGLNLFLGLLYFGMVLGIFFTKVHWKRIAFLTGIVIGVPSFSYAYSMIFIVIPLVLFLNENEGKLIDLFYAVCFVFCLAPMGFNFESILGESTIRYIYTFNVIAMSWALLGLIGVLELECLVTFIMEKKKPKA